MAVKAILIEFNLSMPGSIALCSFFTKMCTMHCVFACSLFILFLATLTALPTQASWRLCEIRQPPTCLHTTSNFVTNTIVIEMVIMVVMIIMVVMVLSGTSWSTWSPWSSWSSGQTGQPGHTEQRGETSREDRQI